MSQLLSIRIRIFLVLIQNEKNGWICNRLLFPVKCNIDLLKGLNALCIFMDQKVRCYKSIENLLSLSKPALKRHYQPVYATNLWYKATGCEIFYYLCSVRLKSWDHFVFVVNKCYQNNFKKYGSTTPFVFDLIYCWLTTQFNIRIS